MSKYPWQNDRVQRISNWRRPGKDLRLIYQLIALLTCLLASLGSLLGLLSWYRPAHALSLVVISDGMRDKARYLKNLPDDNISYLENSELFSRIIRINSFDNLSELLNSDRSENLVIYIDSEAWVSAQGNVLIPCRPNSVYGQEGAIDLTQVLNLLKSNSVRKTVMVLNIFRNQRDFLNGHFREDLWPVTRRIVTSEIGHNIAVFMPDDQGKPELKIPGKLLGLFTHFFIEGLSGLSEINSESPDGVVGIDDLFEYVTIKMNQWTNRYGFNKSEPLVVTKSEKSFLFAYVINTKDKPPIEIASHNYPESLRKAWEQYDTWRLSEYSIETPVLFADLSDRLIQAEKAWMSGASDAEINQFIQEAISDLNQDFQKFHRIPKPSNYSVEWFLTSVHKKIENDPAVVALRSSLANLKAMTENPKIKKEAIIEFIESESKKWVNTYTLQKEPLFKPACVIESAIQHEWTTHEEIQFLTNCLGVEASGLLVETELLYKMEELTEQVGNDGIPLFHKAFVNRILREKILARPEAWPGILKVARPILLKQHESEMILLAMKPWVSKVFAQELNQIQSELQTLVKDQELLDYSRQLITRSMTDMFWIPALLEQFPELEQVIDEYLATIRRLNLTKEELEKLSDAETQEWKRYRNEIESAKTERMNKARALISQLNSQADSLHIQIWNKVGDQVLIENMMELKESEFNRTSVNNIMKILEFPGCSSLVRIQARNILSNYWAKRIEHSPEVDQSIDLNEDFMIDTVDKNSSSMNRRVQAFLLIARYVSPEWSAIQELNEILESSKENSGELTELFEKIDLYYEKWAQEYLDSAEFSKDINLDNTFALMLFRLRNPLDDSTEQRAKKFQNYRIANVEPYYHDAGDLIDYFSTDMGGSPMLRQSAEEIRNITKSVRKVSLRIIASPQTVEYAKSGENRVNVPIDLQFFISALHGMKEPVRIEFVNLSDFPIISSIDHNDFDLSHLKSTDKSSELFNVQIERRLNASLMQNSNLSTTISNRGFNSHQTLLLKTYVNGFVFHTPVPVYVAWPKDRPQISFSFSEADGFNFKKILLRPIETSTPVYVNLTNPSLNFTDLTLKMKMKSSHDVKLIEYVSKPMIINPQQSVSAVFQISQQPKQDPAALQNTTKTEVKPNENQTQVAWHGDFEPTDPELTFEVYDNTQAGLGPILTQNNRFQTADPRDIIDFIKLTYSANLQRMAAQISPRQEFQGTSPAKVHMRIPLQSGQQPDSAVIGIGGNLSGQLAFSKDSEIQIVASPIRLDPLKNGNAGRVIFDVDRYQRAFVFQNRWIQDYQRELTPTPLLAPEMKIVAEPVVQNGNIIRIQFEPTNEPEGASILLECATLNQDSGSLPNYKFVHKLQTSRQELFAVKFDEKIGTISILNGLKDWSYEMPTTGLFGRISLRASLLDQSGKVVASDKLQVLLDDQAARMAEIIGLPNFVKAGSKLNIQMQILPPESGLKQAIAVLDVVKDRKIPENAIQVRLQRENESSEPDSKRKPSFETWSGTVEIPAKTEFIGERPITVIFETGAGLSDQISSHVKIEAADFIEPGMITGSVIQGELPQADLPVVLRKMDAKRTEIRRTSTDKQGQFQMTGISPGTYGLFTAKSSDQTSAQVEVSVASGRVTQLRLGLGRVNLPSNGPAPKAEPTGAGK